MGGGGGGDNKNKVNIFHLPLHCWKKNQEGKKMKIFIAGKKMNRVQNIQS